MKKFWKYGLTMLALLLGLSFVIPKKTFKKEKNAVIEELALELKIPKGLAKIAINTRIGNRIAYAIIKRKVNKENKSNDK